MTTDVDSSPSIPAAADARGPLRRRWKVVLLLLLVSGVLLAALAFRDRLHIEQLVPYESRLRALLAERPATVLGAALVIYVLMVGLLLPGASMLTPLVGWLIGFWKGVLFASLASTTGATLAFLLSRYLLRDFVRRRWGARLDTVSAAVDRDGAYYLLTLRLIPVFPFFLVNLLLGLTRMRTWTFWWASQLGMLPGTCLFVWAGASVPTLAELSRSTGSIWNGQLLAALTALGLFPILLRPLMKAVRPVRIPGPDDAEAASGAPEIPLNEPK